MKITKLLAIALLPSLWYYAQAQEQTTSTEENQKEAASPLKNKVSIAATRVYNNQLSTQLIDPSSSSVTVTAPFAEGKNDPARRRRRRRLLAGLHHRGRRHRRPHRAGPQAHCPAAAFLRGAR